MKLEKDSMQKILLVDDEPPIIRILRTSLSTQGYSLSVAANGIEGLAAVRDWQPELVITDLSMPKMDGIEFCRQLREISEIPVIVLSVSNHEPTKVEALDRYKAIQYPGIVCTYPRSASKTFSSSTIGSEARSVGR